jgi:hypothetical protein
MPHRTRCDTDIPVDVPFYHRGLHPRGYLVSITEWVILRLTRDQLGGLHFSPVVAYKFHGSLKSRSCSIRGLPWNIGSANSNFLPAPGPGSDFRDLLRILELSADVRDPAYNPDVNHRFLRGLLSSSWTDVEFDRDISSRAVLDASEFSPWGPSHTALTRSTAASRKSRFCLPLGKGDTAKKARISPETFCVD